MPHLPRHITPARIAALAAVAAVAAVTSSALIGFYVSMVAVAVMLGAAFTAYLAVVDETGEWAVFELGTCAVAALLTLAGTSIRFPAVVAGTTPSVAVKLAWLALAVSGTAAAASLAREHLRELWSLRDSGIARLTRRI
ncbi:MAG TPA: hypothetical protein VGL44_03610 [Gaiellales bacterium]|jgi:hypothetical protein